MRRKHRKHNWQKWKRFEAPILGTMYGRLCQNCPAFSIVSKPSAVRIVR